MAFEITRAAGAALSVTALLTVAACATSPVPNEKIALATASVQRAEQSGATEAAPVELAAARDKLAQAQQAGAHRDGLTATALAEEADVDAQLAEATAAQHRSRKAAAEFDAGMQALRQESQHNATQN
jgi:hypothetical protein